jgi:hypothetical protein
MKKLHSVFVLLLLLALSGCGNKVKLGGTVVYSDGKPLTCGTIYFSNPNYLARAFIRPDGSYNVGSLSAKDGLPPGKYKVFITGATKTEPNTDPINSMGEKITLLIAPKFTSEETTPLEIEVPGEKVFQIIVERP